VGFEDDLAAEGPADLEFVAGIAARMPRKRVSAGVLYRDGGGRLLVVEPTYKPQWEIPGGVVEEGEEPRAACRREVSEELGLPLPVGDLLVVDWAPPHGVWGDSVNFVFDGGVLPSDALSDAVLPSDELGAWRWEPLDVVRRHVRPSMSRRLTSALSVAADGIPSYLRFGRSRFA
jgi:8-oxo-dGTP pyrophosphatase MutT (NUDIX family)